MNNKEFLKEFKKLPDPSEMVKKLKEIYGRKVNKICGIPFDSLTRIHAYNRPPNYPIYQTIVLSYLGVDKNDKKEFSEELESLPKPDEMVKRIIKMYNDQRLTAAYFIGLSQPSIYRIITKERTELRYTSYRKIVIAYLEALIKNK